MEFVNFLLMFRGEKSNRNFFSITGQSCSFPGSPAHGLVTFSDENLENGAVASYTCERGFELLGPARRVCDQGTWAPEGIPFCGK